MRACVRAWVRACEFLPACVYASGCESLCAVQSTSATFCCMLLHLIIEVVVRHIGLRRPYATFVTGPLPEQVITQRLTDILTDRLTNENGILSIY